MTWEELMAKLQQYKDGAVVTGEMSMAGLAMAENRKVDDIPIATSVDYDKLTDGDENPMEVVVSMQSGKSKRGWNYTPEVVKSIVNQVNSDSPNGFKGHQKAEDVSTEFVDPATHWIGATYDEANKTAYFRGYVDPDERKLRRWIKSGRIKETSIFGEMQLKREKGETNVVGCDLMSIDWTPKGRPGMETKVVDIKGEMEDNNKGGSNNMTWEELKQAIQKFMSENKMSARQVAGEMDSAFIQNIETMESQLPAIRAELDLPETATFEDVKAKLKELKGLETEKEEQEVEAARQEVIKEKFPENEEAQELAGEMVSFTKTTDKKVLTGEMDSVLGKPSIKKMFDNLMTDDVASGKTNNRKQGNTNKGVRVKRNRLN